MITITSVDLRNFKRHKALHVDLTLGTNLIVGSNYAGKSTILQGIGLALLGNSMCPGKSEHFIHDGQKDFEITLSLSNGHKIKRTSKNSTVTDIEGKSVCRSHTAVNKYVEDLLGLDKKIFNKVFLSEQGSPQALLQMEGVELQRFVETCLGMDTLDALVKKCDQSSRDFTNKAEGFSEFVVGERDLLELKSALDSGKHILGVAEKEHYRACEDITEISGNVSQAQIHLSAARREEAAYSKYVTTLQTLEEVLRESPEFQELLPEHATALKLEGLKASLVIQQDTSANTDRLKSDIQDLKEGRRGITYHKNIVAAFSRDFSSIPDNDQEQGLYDQAEISLVARTSELQHTADLLENGVCPTCERALDDSVDKEELSLQKTEQEKLVKLAKEKSVQTKLSLSLANESYKEYYDSKNRADLSEQEVLSLHTSLGDKLSELQELGEVTGEYASGALQLEVEQGQHTLQEIQVSNKVTQENNKTRVASELKMESLQEVKVPDTSVIEASQAAQKIETFLQSKKEEAAQLTLQMQETKSLIATAQGCLDSHNKAYTGFKESTKKGGDYKAISLALKNLREDTVRGSLAQVFTIADQFVSSCTGGDVSSINIQDGGLFYTEASKIRPITSASGAQKSVIGLGLKMGLAKIVPCNVNFMLLDEISADMDVDVSSACMSILGQYTEQSVVVSHRPMDVADNILQL